MFFLAYRRREAPLFSNGFSPGGNFVTDELLCLVLQQTKVSIYNSEKFKYFIGTIVRSMPDVLIHSYWKKLYNETFKFIYYNNP